jgi:pyruvate/2-oxoglutarate dehydrogenase complex dihydrolipoamide acyltransferase (E2) component
MPSLKSGRNYTKERLSPARKALIASAAVTAEKSTIHSFAEADISRPRRLIREYQQLCGERLSFTAYIVACLARTIENHPHLNAFISGSNIIYLPSLTISVLIERQIDGAAIPEPLGIEHCESKSYLDIHNDIRSAQQSTGAQLGELSGVSWIRFVPSFLLKAFVRLADRNVSMGIRYGKVAVTAVGMFSKEPVWVIPHGSPTVLVSVGSIIDRVIEAGGQFESREHLCLTVSFDHDIVDGAPAARFMSEYLQEIKSGNAIRELIEQTRSLGTDAR